MKLSQQDIEKITQRIVDKVNPEQVLLFGSYAKEQATANSDLDILVVKTADRTQCELEAELCIVDMMLAKQFGVDILVDSYAEIHHKNNVFYKDILEDSKVLYAR